jgi:hypothetical protein
MCSRYSSLHTRPTGCHPKQSLPSAYFDDDGKQERNCALNCPSMRIVVCRRNVVNRGQDATGSSQPWIIAFAFGLLHGFEFAGALSETCLPADAVPLALLFFNVDIQVGQLNFVGCVLALGFVIKRHGPG